MAIDFKKYIMSTGTHYISNSGSDENRQYHGGKAGDQTGKEWALKGWYNRPWTVVLRWPDPAVGLKMAQLGIAAALNNKIGYDQWQRTSYWKQLEKASYDPSKITTACEEDCTAGVTANCKATGYLLGVKALKGLATDTYSGNMRSRFVKAGFQALTAKKYLTGSTYLLPGDVLLYEGHHAAMNISYGSKVRPAEAPVLTPITGGAEEIPADSAPKFEPRCVKVTGGDVNVRSAPGTSNRVLGIVHKGDTLPYQGEDRDVNGTPWHLVIYKNQNAWISGKYSKLIDSGGSICDVSKYQGEIDWDKLAPALHFVVIKASGLYENGADPCYVRNVAGAVAHGVPFHAFHFLYCQTEKQAKRDAKLFYDTVRAAGHDPLFWVLDCEKGWGIPINKARTVAEAFEAELRRLAGADIRVAVYIGHNVYKDYGLDYGRYAYVWIPRYGEKNDGTIEGSKRPDYPCDLWQYTSHGRLPGIGGDVDLDVLSGDKPLGYFTGKDKEA